MAFIYVVTSSINVIKAIQTRALVVAKCICANRVPIAHNKFTMQTFVDILKSRIKCVFLFTVQPWKWNYTGTNAKFSVPNEASCACACIWTGRIDTICIEWTQCWVVGGVALVNMCKKGENRKSIIGVEISQKIKSIWFIVVLIMTRVFI